MAKIVGTFWDVESDTPVFSSAVDLRTVDGKETIVSVVTDMDGGFVIDDVAPGEYMIVGRSFVHHPCKLLLLGDDKVVEPGITVRLQTSPAVL